MKPAQLLPMNNFKNESLYRDAIRLLKQLIATPSFSRQEQDTAQILQHSLTEKNIPFKRLHNNVWAHNQFFDRAKPTILLNSHHDTVPPNKAYTVDPYSPVEADGKLYGLGSNDAGGCLVSLMAAFIHFYPQQQLSHNLVFAATAEEEISGANGIEALLKDDEFYVRVPGGINYGIVGEPTLLQLAIAERGLMVLDATAHGKAGHAAREEGENAIYKAVKDIHWFGSYRFEKESEWLGPVKMNVTVINTENKAHNVVPAQCTFVVDVRVNELYTFEEVLQTIRQFADSEIVPRSTRLRSTSIPVSHPLVKAGISMGKTCYGSPTTSDKALMPFPTLKTGPGDSARSHTADEFIYLLQIQEGIHTYIELLNNLLIN